AHETVRDQDGLALSSRNAYLSAAERAEAPQLYAVLRQIQGRLEQGCVDHAELEGTAAAELARRGWQVDYLTVRRQRDLGAPTQEEIQNGEPLVALGAAKLGATRLIDNLEMQYWV